MPTFPCQRPASLCIQDPLPTTGYSSETVDGPTFIGVSWSSVKPLLGKVFSVYPCEAICDSQVSQESASLCSDRGVVGCQDTCAPLFQNSTQTQSGNCGDGNDYFYTTPAGWFSALSQLAADQLASQFSAAKVIANPLCISEISHSPACHGEFYSGTINVTGNSFPFSASIVSGGLPPGLVMDLFLSRISISGVPFQNGSFEFQIQASNSAGVFTLRNYSITVAACVT